MAEISQFFINLDVFYALNPDLRHDPAFQEFLNSINTGKEDANIPNSNLQLSAAQILDQQEIRSLLSTVPSDASHGTTLWNYAIEKVDGKELKDVVQNRFFKTTTITGNLFLDLKNEIESLIKNPQLFNEFSLDIKIADYAPQAKKIIVSLDLFENSKALYKYYAAEMDWTTEELYLVLYRLAKDLLVNKKHFSFEVALEEDTKETQLQILNEFLDRLKTASKETPKLFEEPSPKIYPEWITKPGPANINSLIENQIYSFYQNLKPFSYSGTKAPREALITLIENTSAEFSSMGCNQDFIDNLLSYETSSEKKTFELAQQILQKLDSFLRHHGYKAYDLYLDKTNRFVLAKSLENIVYQGIGTGTDVCSTYQILPIDLEKAEFNFYTEQSYPLDENIAAIFQLFKFSPEILKCFESTKNGKQLVENFFGKPSKINNSIFTEFSLNLQKAIFIVDGVEGSAGEFDPKKRFSQIFAMALDMSQNKEQLFLVLYAASLGVFQKWTLLKSSLMELMQNMSLPDDMSSNHGTITIRQTLPILGFIPSETDYRDVLTIQKICDFFLHDFSNETEETNSQASVNSLLSEACQEIIGQNSVLANPDKYFILEESESAPSLGELSSTKSFDLENGFSLVWFERAAKRMGLSAEQFLKLDASADGMLQWSELATSNWSIQEKTIFENVIQKHRLFTFFSLQKAIFNKDNLQEIPFDVFTNEQLKIFVKKSYRSYEQQDMIAEKIPRYLIRKSSEPTVSRKNLQMLFAKYPSLVRKTLEKTYPDIKLLEEINDIFNSKKPDETKLELTQKFLFENPELPGNILISLAYEIATLNVPPPKWENFFKKIPSTTSEMLLFFGSDAITKQKIMPENLLRFIIFKQIGNVPSVQTFLVIVQNDDVYYMDDMLDYIFEMFEYSFMQEKPEWFDPFWQAILEDSTKGQTIKISNFLNLLSKKLDQEWVKTFFLENASTVDFYFKDLLDPQNFNKPSLETLSNLYPFAWEYSDKIGVEKSELLTSLIKFYKRFDEYDHFSRQAVIKVIEKIVDAADLNSLIDATKNQPPKETLFLIAIILKQKQPDSTQIAKLKTLWLGAIQHSIPSSSYALFSEIGLVGELALGTLYTTLGLDESEKKLSNSTLTHLFVNFEILETQFNMANAYFLQMQKETTGESGVQYLNTKNIDESLRNCTKRLDTFSNELMQALMIVLNPKSPDTEKDKKEQFKQEIDKWIEETPSTYIKLLLLFCRWNLDPTTNIQEIYKLRDQLIDGDSSVSGFERAVYNNSTMAGPLYKPKEILNWTKNESPLKPVFAETASQDPQRYWPLISNCRKIKITQLSFRTCSHKMESPRKAKKLARAVCQACF